MSNEHNTEVLAATGAYVRDELSGEGTGHDYHHSRRVAALARRIAEEEGADTFVAELAGLLHDIEDEKFSGDPEAGPRAAREWLTQLGVDDRTTCAVVQIIATMSFKGAGVEEAPMTLEGRCVRDADRLEAIGAIGIARTFAYGGKVGRPIHDPETAPVMAGTSGEYRSNLGTTLNHFPEKLFLLADRMSTDAGRRLARERHEYMVEFHDRFLAEWSGEL